MNLQSAIQFEVIDEQARRVAVPIATTASEVDFSRTEGGGEKGSVTRQDLQQMVSNFDQFGFPVPVGFGEHVADRSGASPAFVESLEMRGDDLWAVIQLGPQAWSSVVESGEWRGFSIEAAKDLKKPTKTFSGWVLVGGTFTNRPALPVNFAKIAASEVLTATTLTAAPGHEKESSMSDENVVQLKATNDALKGEVKSLKADNESATDRARILSGRLTEAESDNAQLKAQVDTLTRSVRALEEKSERDSKALEAKTAELDSVVKQTTTDQLIALANEINQTRDVPATFFEGIEDDPLKWLSESGFTDLAALKKVCSMFPKASSPAPAPSGRRAMTDQSRLGESEDDAKLRALGLDPKTADIRTAIELADYRAKTGKE